LGRRLIEKLLRRLGPKMGPGQQRLTSFFDFLDGQFTLTGLRIRTDLQKQTYADLAKNLQSKIRKAAIRTVTIQKESDDDLKFDIFERTQQWRRRPQRSGASQMRLPWPIQQTHPGAG